MSMNLEARTKNQTIHLWQTPTQISYTILPGPPGVEVKGVKAKEALIRYMEWVRHSSNGVWGSHEELKKYEEQIKEHLSYIEPFLEDKSLRLWVM